MAVKGICTRVPKLESSFFPTRYGSESWVQRMRNNIYFLKNSWNEDSNDWEDQERENKRNKSKNKGSNLS